MKRAFERQSASSALRHPIFLFEITTSNGDGRLFLRTTFTQLPVQTEACYFCCETSIYFALATVEKLPPCTIRTAFRVLDYSGSSTWTRSGRHPRTAGILTHATYIKQGTFGLPVTGILPERPQPHLYLSSSSPLVLSPGKKNTATLRCEKPHGRILHSQNIPSPRF